MAKKLYVGLTSPGSFISSIRQHWVPVWNAWDDIGLIKGMLRRPHESNITFRDRLIAAVDYTAHVDGIARCVADSCDLTAMQITGKRIFTSKYIPLSYAAYMQLATPEDEYVSPSVVVGDETFIFPLDEGGMSRPADFSGVDDDGALIAYGYSAEKVYIENSLTNRWTLWKNNDQTFLQIWEASYFPADIELHYQTVIDGVLYMVEESPKKYARNTAGEIIES